MKVTRIVINRRCRQRSQSCQLWRRAYNNDQSKAGSFAYEKDQSKAGSFAYEKDQSKAGSFAYDKGVSHA